MRRDPWKHRERYEEWKRASRDGVPGISMESFRVIRQFLEDMEVGRNTAPGTRKGGRSYPRLNNLRQRLLFLARAFEQAYGVPLTGVTEEQVHAHFTRMRTGEIRRLDGRPYRSTGDYVNVFKTFWHWHVKVERRQGGQVPDICIDLDHRSEKAPWVYLTRDDVELLCRHAKFQYRALMLFLFDAGLRSPTELVNVRVRDLAQDCTQLQIRDETSKTFGRTIKLLLSPELLRMLIRERRLRPDDYLFSISPLVVNRYLRRLAARILGHEESPGGKPYSRLTMYDFRHSSACYWLPRYKSETALKYRFGWKKSSMIEYYTGFLGMRDTITQEDLFVGDERSQVERQLEQSTREKALLEERLATLDRQLQEVLRVVSGLVERAA